MRSRTLGAFSVPRNHYSSVTASACLSAGAKLQPETPRAAEQPSRLFLQTFLVLGLTAFAYNF